MLEPISRKDNECAGRAERVTALAFGLAVLGWMTPGIATALQSPLAKPLKHAKSMPHLKAGKGMDKLLFRRA